VTTCNTCRNTVEKYLEELFLTLRLLEIFQIHREREREALTTQNGCLALQELKMED
jgi:hypothetical protein